MKKRPILFSGEMVRAILEGRKTQTRRVVKHITMLGDPAAWCAAALSGAIAPIIGDYRRFCPYGRPGARLWVRETWAESGLNRIEYKAHPADGSDFRSVSRWRPSIHMPRWASRITLEITGVRVERLQDISEEDAVSEGIKPVSFGLTDNGYEWSPLENGTDTAKESFVALWNSIYGPGSWASNPWVWVIEFKRINQGAAQ